MKIFISHYHGDKQLADGLKELIKNAFADVAEIFHSSDDSVEGGIQAGEPWFDWVIRQVKETDHTIVILTPDSIVKPWIMWESGAVAGVALAKDVIRKSPVIPIYFRVLPEDIPGPLKSLNAVDGTQKSAVIKVLGVLNETCKEYKNIGRFEGLMDKFATDYLEVVKKALADKPMQLHEADIQEWTSRLDALRTSHRYGEVEHVHQALKLVFTSPESDDIPLDLRIHRRLGELYLEMKKGEEAVRQFTLGMKISSQKDVFLLHQLAQAHLEANNLGLAKEAFQQITNLDENLPKNNPEIAGLQGRLYREIYEKDNDPKDLKIARDAYWVAMEQNRDSYFLADVAGQLSLLLGQKDKAEEAYRSAIKAIDELEPDKKDMWCFATLAAASIVINDDPKALEYLRELARLRPSPRHLDRIKKGLERVKAGLKECGRDVSDAIYNQWIEAIAIK